jgi:hypothetical protein
MADNSSFTGTAVGTSGTLAALVTRILITLNDEGNATWDTEMIATFLNDAIRDYSQHFPRIRTDSIAMTTGTAEYDLNADYQGILSVEYPDGEDPREYLLRRPYTHDDFWSEEDYYDIIPAADDNNPSQIVISSDVATGETAVVEYLAHHQLITDTGTITGSNTVPPLHQQLLTKYCQWQAAAHLASAEQQTPTSNSSLLMAQLAQNARRLELSYATALQQAIYADEGKSTAVNWMKHGSGMQRVY